MDYGLAGIGGDWRWTSGESRMIGDGGGGSGSSTIISSDADVQGGGGSGSSGVTVRPEGTGSDTGRRRCCGLTGEADFTGRGGDCGGSGAGGFLFRMTDALSVFKFMSSWADASIRRISWSGLMVAVWCGCTAGSGWAGRRWAFLGGRSGGVGPLLPLLHPSMLIFLPEAGIESAAEAATRAALELNQPIKTPNSIKSFN